MFSIVSLRENSRKEKQMILFIRKKLSIFSTYQDWNHSSNYIAKRYKDNVLTARYFDDVMMQMTTKLWATHYNRHNPPKKVYIHFIY